MTYLYQQYKTKHVVLDQYLGIMGLITISLIGSLIGLFIDQKYIGLLGILPVYFGIGGIILLTQHREDNNRVEAKVNTTQSNKTLSVAAVTFCQRW